MTTDEAMQTNGRPYWHHLLEALLRQRRFIALVLFVGTLASVAVLLSRRPVYEATAHLAVVAERARVIVSPDPKTGAVNDGVTEQDLNSEVALLRSDVLLREVLKSQGADGTATESAGGIGAILEEALALPGTLYRRLHGVHSDPVDDQIQIVRERLEVEPVKASNLIRISYREDDPEQAAGLVNALAQHHVERPSAASPSNAQRFFERQQEVLYEGRRQAEHALREFYEREGLSQPPEDEAALREQIRHRQATAAKAQTALTEAEAEAQFLRAELERHPRTLRGAKPAAGASSDPLQLVRARIVELELERSKLLGQFAPTSSRIQDVDRQLERARGIAQREAAQAEGILSQTRESLTLALAKAETEVAGLRARTEALNRQIASDQPRLVHLEQIASERDRLEQEVAAAREALATYRRKQEEARFSSALDRSRIVNVSIVEPARVPSAPLPSARIAAGLLGVAFSLFAAIAFALVRDRLDPTVKSTADAAEIAGTPVLADLTA